MGNYENIRGKGFEARPWDINKKGRPPSIKRALKKMLDENGNITIPKKNVVADDGKTITVKLPTAEAMALKLISVAMSKHSQLSLRAMKLIMQYIDGLPKQKVEMEFPELPDIQFVDAAAQKEIEDLQRRNYELTKALEECEKRHNDEA